MKKIIFAILAIIVMAACLAGCGGGGGNQIIPQYRIAIWQSYEETTVLLAETPFQIDVLAAGQRIETRGSGGSNEMLPYIEEIIFLKDGVQVQPREVRGGPPSYILSSVGDYTVKVRFSINGVEQTLLQSFTVKEDEGKG